MTRSDGFYVDPDALSHANDGVGRLLRDMDGFADLTSDQPDSVFGNAELADSAAEFRDKWQDGIKELSTDAESIHRRLADTIEEYRRVDEDTAANFARIREDDGRE